MNTGAFVALLICLGALLFLCALQQRAIEKLQKDVHRLKCVTMAEIEARITTSGWTTLDQESRDRIREMVGLK